MNRKIALLISILCISVVFIGCQNNNVVEKQKFVFSDKEFNELLLEIGQMVKNDIENMKDSYDFNKTSEEMANDELIQKFRFYNDSDLTKEQREKLDIALRLNLDKSLYLLTPNDKKTKDKLFETSLRYIKLIDENYSLTELLYGK